MPPPPPLLSTTTCCFHMSVSFSAIRRAKMSAAWPGGNGTMKRTGFDGQGAWARARVAMKGDAKLSATAWRRVITIIVPPGVILVESLACLGGEEAPRSRLGKEERLHSTGPWPRDMLKGPANPGTPTRMNRQIEARL